MKRLNTYLSDYLNGLLILKILNFELPFRFVMIISRKASIK